MSALVVIAISSWGLGYGAMRLLKVSHGTSLSCMGVAMGTGLGIWSMLLFGLGHAGLLMRPFLIILASLGAIASAMIFVLKKPVTLHVSGWGPRPTLFIKACFAGTTLILLLSFLACFAPVAGGIGNDEVSCHLFIPKLWLAQGNMDTLPYLTSYQAGGGDLLFLLAGCFSAGPGQRMVSWLAFVLCLAILYNICRPRLGKNSAIICVTIAAINPLIFRTASIAFTDIVSALFVLLGLWALLEYEQSRDKHHLWLMALHTGMGIAIKPTNMFYSVCLFIMAAIPVFRSMPSGKAFKTMLIAACIAGSTGALWPMRSLLLTGSPVFPPPIQAYGHMDISPWLNREQPFSQQDIEAFYGHVLSRYGTYTRSLIHCLRFPWDLTMDPGRFQAGDSLGAVLLAMLPLLLLLLPVQGWVWYIVAFASSAGALLYAFVLPEARYFIPAYMALCIPTALVADRLAARKSTRLVSGAVICLNLVFSCAVALRIYHQPIQAAFSEKARDQYRAANTPFFEAFEYLKAVNAGLVVLPKYSEMSYYLTSQCIVERAIENRAAQYPGAYILDMDYSQALKRNLERCTHEFALTGAPAHARLVFEGRDARIYKVSKL